MASPKFTNEDIQKIIEENQRLAMENAVLREAVPEKKEIKSQGFLSKFWSGFQSPRKLEKVSSESDLRNTKQSFPSALDFETPDQSPKGIIPANLRADLQFELSENNVANKISNDSSEVNLLSDLMNQTSIIAKQSAMMTTHVMKVNEKEEIGTVKAMKTVEDEDIHLFLSKFVPDSNQSAVHQVPKELRIALGQILKIPDDYSLVNFYKDSIGPNQKFIRDLRDYLIADRDFDIISLIKIHAISKSSEYSITKLFDMIAKCKQELKVFGGQLTVKNNLQIKKAIFNNIGPQVFFNYLKDKYGDLIISDHCTIIEMINYVEKGMRDYSGFIKQQKAMTAATGVNLSINTSITTTDTTGKKPEIKKDKKAPSDNEKKPATDDKSPKQGKGKFFGKSCWNCEACGDKFHLINDCPELCKIHKKKCDNKHECFQNHRAEIDAKKEKEKINTICIESNGKKCSNIYDPGASATASHKRELFNKDSIIYDKKSNSVEVGNGATIDISGKGKIGNKDVFFVPDLNKTVIATDVTLSEGRVNIMIGDRLLVLKKDIKILEKLIEIEKIAESENLIVVELAREAGLYPMNDNQATRLCSSDSVSIDNLDDANNIFDESENSVKKSVDSMVIAKSKEVQKCCSKSDPCQKKSVTWLDEDVYCNSCTLDTFKVSTTYFTVENSKLADEMLFWHKNWNHAAKRDMISIVENKIFKNLPRNLTIENINKHLPVCNSCPLGSMRTKPVPQISSRIYTPGECCVGDTKHMTIPDINGNIYLTTFTDRGSDKTFGYLHKKLDNLIDLIRDVNNQYKANGYSMKVLGLDHQYKTKEIADYLLRANLNHEKIEQEFPAPHEHASNGKAENVIQKIENEIIKVQADSGSPKEYWGPIAMNVIKIRNCLNSKRNPLRSRNEMWGLQKTDLNNSVMIPFGSRTLAHVTAKNSPPLAHKCFPTISMGWADGVKGGIVLRNLVTNKNIIRRTFKVMGPGDSSLYDSSFDVNIEIEMEDDDEKVEEFDDIENVKENNHDRDYIELNRNSSEMKNKTNYFNYRKLTFHDNFDKTYWKVIAVVKENRTKGPGSRTPFFKYYDVDKFIGGPLKEEDFEYSPCAELLKDKNIQWDDIRNRDEVKVNTIVSMGCALRVFRVDFKDAVNNPPPKNIDEARFHKEKGYFEAFLKEVEGFHKRKADVPADIDIKDIDPNLILQLIPIFQKKFSGTDFEKFKCRMVVLGNHWKNVNGINTSASMSGIDTLKLILALGASLDMDMVKFDIKEAYLSTSVDLQDSYYTRRPPGVRNNEMAYIMKPACFVYGHPLANKKFRLLLISILSRMGAKASVYDPNLFVIDNIFGRALIPTIVDDMPTMYEGGEIMLNFLKEGLSEMFEITCDDPLTSVLGMEISRDRIERTITLRQRGAQYNLFNNHLPSWEGDNFESFAKIPKSPNGPLSMKNQELSKKPLSIRDIKVFQSIVGELNWITNTAPDFIYATRCSARAMVSPSEYDMKELMQIVSCMAGIVRQDKDGLTIGGKDIDLVFTTDTSYHGFSDLKSCTGGTMHLNSLTGSIHSVCEKHTITADSAMAAEGIGAHIHIKRALPVIFLFEELGYKLINPAKFYMDNIPFMKTIKGEKGASHKSKHMLIRLQVTKEAFEDGKISLEHLRSENMVADILTKALSYDKWSKLREPLLGNSPIEINNDEDDLLNLNAVRFLFI